MPNAYNDKPLLDPKFLRKVCEDHGIPFENWFGKPNSMRIPLGRGPGRGFVLMRKEDLDAIDQTTYHDLQFSGLDAFKKIYVVSAECISPGGPDDVGDVFLVELADRRIALEKIPCSAAYNLRAADGSAIITATQNSGTDWTWQQILNDLWTLLGAGSTPTLPFTPDATPENFDYRNSFAWAAITDFLDRLACAVKYNPFTDVFTIVRLGSADATAASAADNYVLVWDSKPFDTVPAARPEKVRVLFRRFPSPSDRGNEYYAVDVTLTATTGTVSGSFVTIYDDLGALGATGTPSNSAALSTRATERANDWLRKHDGFDVPSVQVFDSYETTAINILGSTCGEIAYDDRGAGAKTSVKSQVTRTLENWHPGGFSGTSDPALAWVKASSTNGTSPYNYNQATISTFDAATGAWSEGSTVWLTSHHGGADLSANTHYLARLNGTMTNGSSVTHPLYVTIADADVVGSTAYAGLIGTGAQAIDGLKNFRSGISVIPSGSVGSGLYSHTAFSIVPTGGVLGTNGVNASTDATESLLKCGSGSYYVMLNANPSGGSTSEIHLGAAGTIYMRDGATGGRIEYMSGGAVYFPDGIGVDDSGTPTAGGTQDVVISGTTLRFVDGIFITSF